MESGIVKRLYKFFRNRLAALDPNSKGTSHTILSIIFTQVSTILYNCFLSFFISRKFQEDWEILYIQRRSEEDWHVQIVL